MLLSRRGSPGVGQFCASLPWLGSVRFDIDDSLPVLRLLLWFLLERLAIVLLLSWGSRGAEILSGEAGHPVPSRSLPGCRCRASQARCLHDVTVPIYVPAALITTEPGRSRSRC
jgi:hypothetical protein